MTDAETEIAIYGRELTPRERLQRVSRMLAMLEMLEQRRAETISEVMTKHFKCS